MDDTKPYLTLMAVEDLELEADAMARASMESRCSDCGHTCGEEVMTRYCDGWRDELKEAREDVRQMLEEEKATLKGSKP